MMSRSMLELRQQSEFLETGDDVNRLMMNLDTTAVDDWQDVSGAKNGKKKVRMKSDTEI